jgi:hypothetical protein
MEQQPEFRFTGKEIAVLIIGTALALGSLRAEDPYVIVPMLAVSWITFLYICGTHEGPWQWRFGIAAIITLTLAAIGGRLFWSSIVATFQSAAAWIRDLHGPWFDRLIGAFWLLVILAGLFALRSLLIRANHARRTILTGQKGFLDYKLEVETALTSIPGILNKISIITAEVAPAMERHTASIVPTEPTERHIGVSKEAAQTLERFSRRIDKVLREYESVGASLVDGLDGWSKWLGESSQKKTTMVPFITALKQVVPTMATVTVQTVQYADTVRHMKGVSMVLNAGIDRHVQSVDRIAEVNNKIRGACVQAIQRMETMPEA